MKSEQIKHSLSVGIKSIQSRVFDSETDEVISFVKIPIKDSGLVRCEKGTREMNERIEMLKEMVEKTNKPVGWIGYHEGHLVSFLQTQKQVDLFLKNTDTAGTVKPVYTHPVKELTREDRLKLIGTLKWAEDLLRVAGHDEAVSDVQDCIMLLRKVQKK